MDAKYGVPLYCLWCVFDAIVMVIIYPFWIVRSLIKKRRERKSIGIAHPSDNS